MNRSGNGQTTPVFPRKISASVSPPDGRTGSTAAIMPKRCRRRITSFRLRSYRKNASQKKPILPHYNSIFVFLSVTDRKTIVEKTPVLRCFPANAADSAQTEKKSIVLILKGQLYNVYCHFGYRRFGVTLLWS